MKKSDSWCTPLTTKSGQRLSGGAARNVRIAKSGGMDEIIEKVTALAVREALQMANLAVAASSKSQGWTGAAPGPARKPRVQVKQQSGAAGLH